MAMMILKSKAFQATLALAALLVLGGILVGGFRTYRRMMFEPDERDRARVAEILQETFGESANLIAVPRVNRDVNAVYADVRLRPQALASLEKRGELLTRVDGRWRFFIAPRPADASSQWVSAFTAIVPANEDRHVGVVEASFPEVERRYSTLQ